MLVDVLENVREAYNKRVNDILATSLVELRHVEDRLLGLKLTIQQHLLLVFDCLVDRLLDLEDF